MMMYRAGFLRLN